MIRTLPLLLLLAACVNPLPEMELVSSSVEFGSGPGILQGVLQVRSISQDPMWVYGITTNAPAETDPEQDLASFDHHPLDLPLDGVEIAPGAKGEMPLSYDCAQTDVLGTWAVGLRVVSGPDEGGAELAVWDLGVLDLMGNCTETR